MTLFADRRWGTLEWARAQEMAFGKHTGRPLKWIEDHDVMYLEWLVHGVEIRIERLREAAKLLYEHNRGRIENERRKVEQLRR